MTLNEVLSRIRDLIIFDRGLFIKNDNPKFNKWLDKEGLIYLCKKCYNFGYEQRDLDLQQEKKSMG